MSFDANASFGQEDFVADNQNNNTSFGKNEDTKQILSQDIDNIFDSVPMEIENEEDPKTKYYKEIKIKENIENSLYSIYNILKQKILFSKLSFFFKLKQISNMKYSKLVKAEILFMSIERSFSIFLKIYNKNKAKQLSKCFNKIKNFAKILKYKGVVEKKEETDLKNKIKIANDTLSKYQKTQKDISTNLETLKNNEKNINNEIEGLEKKYSGLNEKYNELIKKSKAIKESISLSKQKSYNLSSTMDKTLDPRIIELQNKIKAKENEREKSLVYFEDFYQKMSDLLSSYESNYETIVSTINTTNTTNQDQ